MSLTVVVFGLWWFLSSSSRGVWSGSGTVICTECVWVLLVSRACRFWENIIFLTGHMSWEPPADQSSGERHKQRGLRVWVLWQIRKHQWHDWNLDEPLNHRRAELLQKEKNFKHNVISHFLLTLRVNHLGDCYIHCVFMRKSSSRNHGPSLVGVPA